MKKNFTNKKIFISIDCIDDFLDIKDYIELSYLPGAIYVIDPDNIDLWIVLSDDYKPICSARTITTDAQVLSLINRKYSYALSTNSNIHILTDKIITPCVTYDEAVMKAQHGSKNILWFGDEDGAINIKKIGSDVIAYVNDYTKINDWDFVDGFWFSFDDEFKKQVKGF